jgi:hypothetical protein
MSVAYADISKPLKAALYSALSGHIYTEIDEITLTGTSGTATVLNNGVSKTATFATSLTLTASNFVTTNAAAYLVAGTILISDGVKLIFRNTVLGSAFTGNTTITNASGTLAGTVVVTDEIYPVYKSIPKTPADNYIYVGGIIQAEDGTKDEFIYTGTLQVKVVTDRVQRADSFLAESMLNVVRAHLQPTKGAVLSLSGNTMVTLTPEGMTELSEQTELGMKIQMIDLYTFLIQ